METEEEEDDGYLVRVEWWLGCNVNVIVVDDDDVVVLGREDAAAAAKVRFGVCIFGIRFGNLRMKKTKVMGIKWYSGIGYISFLNSLLDILAK